jgi:hypothetical protein
MQQITAHQFRVEVDAFGRDVVVVDDATAAGIAAWRKTGWREVHGFNYGESRETVAGESMFETLSALKAAADGAGLDEYFLAWSESRQATGEGVIVTTCGVSSRPWKGSLYLAG